MSARAMLVAGLAGVAVGGLIGYAVARSRAEAAAAEAAKLAAAGTAVPTWSDIVVPMLAMMEHQSAGLAAVTRPTEFIPVRMPVPAGLARTVAVVRDRIPLTSVGDWVRQFMTTLGFVREILRPSVRFLATYADLFDRAAENVERISRIRTVLPAQTRLTYGRISRVSLLRTCLPARGPDLAFLPGLQSAVPAGCSM